MRSSQRAGEAQPPRKVEARALRDDPDWHANRLRALGHPARLERGNDRLIAAISERARHAKHHVLGAARTARLEREYDPERFTPTAKRAGTRRAVDGLPRDA